MPKPRRQDGSKTNNRLRDIKSRNEAKYQGELSPAIDESTPDAEELEFQKNLDYLLNNERNDVPLGSEEQAYIAANRVNEIEISLVSQGDKKSGKVKSSKHSQRQKNLTVAEIIGDIGELEFSSDEEDVPNVEAETKAMDPKDGSTKKSKKKPKNKEKNHTKDFVGQAHDSSVNNANENAKPKTKQNNPSNIAEINYSKKDFTEMDQDSQDGINDKSKHNPKKTRKKKSKDLNSTSEIESKLKRYDEEQNVPKSETMPPIKKRSKAKKSNQARYPKGPSTEQEEAVEFAVLNTDLALTHCAIQQTREDGSKKLKGKKSQKKRNTPQNESNGNTVGSSRATSKNSSKRLPENKKRQYTDSISGSEIDKSTNYVEQSDDAKYETGVVEVVENESSTFSQETKRGTPQDQARKGEPALSLSLKLSMTTKGRTESSNSVSSLFGVTLKSLKLSSSRSEHLPELSPIKTIIGVSHRQILTADLSDVKIKTIINAPSISKYASNSMKFAKKYENKVFNNYKLKKQFLTLCFNVALYESNGFKKSVNQHPDILDNFGHYDELNLTNTHTAITASEKELHRNTLDYSVFAYFGHILIWALHLQRKAKVPLFIDEYGISVSPDEIKMKIGGLHLWDKIFRELKGMNAKRWKHVLKFRNVFALEEDQFMVILRFMKITDIP